MSSTNETEVIPTTTMSGEADETPERDYLVRLLFRIPAETPEQAVERYLEQLLSHGLRNWSFRVEDEETGDMYHLDGYGQPVETASVVEVTSDDESGD